LYEIAQPEMQLVILVVANRKRDTYVVLAGVKIIYLKTAWSQIRGRRKEIIGGGSVVLPKK
jgi:hypothetical protein